MTKALQIINGVPRMRLISGADAIYDESIAVTSTITSGTEVTLPNNGAYASTDLEVYLEGQFLEPGLDYNYVGTGDRNKVTFTYDLNSGDRVRFRIEGDSDTIYDETTVIGVGGVSTGVSIDVPNAQTYTGDELEVFLNGQFLEPLLDYNYVGTSPYSQIAVTFDLNENERLRFRIDR